MNASIRTDRPSMITRISFGSISGTVRCKKSLTCVLAGIVSENIRIQDDTQQMFSAHYRADPAVSAEPAWEDKARPAKY